MIRIVYKVTNESKENFICGVKEFTYNAGTQELTVHYEESDELEIIRWVVHMLVYALEPEEG